MTEKFNVTGMTCSACSAHVEKSVKKLNGVKSVNVNLLQNNMHVDFDETAVSVDDIINAVNEQDRPIVYLLWGRPAQSKIPMLTNPKHLILKAPHPSPLSAYRGFFGCRHFSQTNEFLQFHELEPIDWQIENI